MPRGLASWSFTIMSLLDVEQELVVSIVMMEDKVGTKPLIDFP